METKPLPAAWLETMASVADDLGCEPHAGRETPSASIGAAWFKGEMPV